MPSSRAILSDILHKGLDPKTSYTSTGKDGKLMHHISVEQKIEQPEQKVVEQDEEIVIEDIDENIQSEIDQQSVVDITIEDDENKKPILNSKQAEKNAQKKSKKK